MKLDKYKRRQLGALILLIVLIVVIVLMVKCTSSVIRGEKDTEEISPEVTETAETVPEEEEPEQISLIQAEKPESFEYRDISDLPFAGAELELLDISMVNERYMNDIAVIGDSIALGYSVYGRLKEDSVLAVGSVGVRNILETDIKYQGYQLKIDDIISRKKPKYIFISLGMNDINWRTEEQYITDYKNLISVLQTNSPESYIFACAITPVSHQTTFTKNDKIDTYNEDLRKMVYDYKSDKIFYVNAARCLKGDDNYLMNEFSSGDGIHLAAAAYDYLLTYMISVLDWI